MNIETIAREMRERALLIEGNDQFDESSLRNHFEILQAKANKIKKLEELKKLYFNAGRWVGGDRDHTARTAFEKINAKLKEDSPR